jgi:coenzyme F420-reducing hydrogenase alpha subunit
MAARLVEMKALLSGDAPSPFRAPGVVETARGTLVVRASLDAEGKVATFERRTPTDDMLAEDGPLKAALETLPANDDRLESLARLVVDVLDPCLAHEITVDRETGDGGANDA